MKGSFSAALFLLFIAKAVCGFMFMVSPITPVRPSSAVSCSRKDRYQFGDLTKGALEKYRVDYAGNTGIDEDYGLRDMLSSWLNHKAERRATRWSRKLARRAEKWYRKLARKVETWNRKSNRKACFGVVGMIREILRRKLGYATDRAMMLDVSTEQEIHLDFTEDDADTLRSLHSKRQLAEWDAKFLSSSEGFK